MTMFINSVAHMNMIIYTSHLHSFTHIHTLTCSLSHNSILDVNVLPYLAVSHMHTCYKFIHIHSCSRIKSLPHTSILIVPQTYSHIHTCSLFTDARNSYKHRLQYMHVYTFTQLHEFAHRFTYTLACLYLLMWTHPHIHLYPCIILLTNKTTYSVTHRYILTLSGWLHHHPWTSLHIHSDINTLNPSYMWIHLHIHAHVNTLK